ncbi:DBP2 [Symbiodinium sp. CCMP2456]|nr:DBP2 [Symbiodinium sp. CCMP2456]
MMILNFAKSTACGHRVMRTLCAWEPDPDFPHRAPLRVKLFNLLLPLFMFTWNAIGIHWARLSTAPQVPRLVCQEESQGVIDAILAFATVNIALTVFMFLNIVGLAYFFRMLLRMGVVQSSKAAPEGSLEASTEKVTAETAKLGDSPQCPICLEDAPLQQSVYCRRVEVRLTYSRKSRGLGYCQQTKTCGML